MRKESVILGGKVETRRVQVIVLLRRSKLIGGRTGFCRAVEFFLKIKRKLLEPYTCSTERVNFWLAEPKITLVTAGCCCAP